MSYYLDSRAGSWVVQIQRTAPDQTKVRRCKRVRGTKADAMKLEAEMTAEVEQELVQLQQQLRQEQQRLQAARTLGLDLTSIESGRDSKKQPTLREFLTGRWAEHSQVAQNATTRRTTRSHVAYIIYHLGPDRRLDELHEGDVARLRERLILEGPKSFSTNRNGQPRKPRVDAFTPLAVNRILATFAAAMNLAERERIIERAPHVALLPADDSQPLVPPSDEELQAILTVAHDFREIAPLMPEAIELAAETGMRAGEQFTRTWRFIDFKMGETGAIRIEKQPKVKLIDGKAWTPKHKKARIIPLTPRARELLLFIRDQVPHGPDDPVIPSRGGSPYVRLEAAPDKAGMGYFAEVVGAALPGAKIRWHDLRHYFAVRALLKGVPIAVVSAWLGHSDVNLTVKRYGRWASEAREQWRWAKAMGEPTDAIARTPALGVIEGGREAHRPR
jgi:integrase